MSSTANPERRRRVWRRAVIGFALLGIVIVAGLYLTSDSFQDRVRRKLIVELERVTGARVEVKQFSWNLAKLEVEANDVTLHGLEDPSDIPYAHVERIYARAKILSFFGREIGLRAVVIQRPVVHILVFPDGSTNQPVPKVKSESHISVVDRLFDLAIDHAELNEGVLLFNDKRIPFDFSGNQVSASLDYVLLAHRYDAAIHIGQMDATYTNFLPLRSSADVEVSLARDGAQLKALHWASAKSKVEASGRMTNFNDPRIDVSYNVALDLAELGGLAHRRELRNGKLLVTGQGSYTVAEFSTAGRVVLQNAIWVEDGLNVPGLTASANFSAQRDRIAISNMNGTVLGGRISGDADIFHWSQAAEKTGARTKATAGQPQRGSATIKMHGLSVAEMAAAVSTAAFPVGRVQPVGSADGTIDMTWTGSPRNAETSVALDVAPPASPKPNELPINARLRLAYLGASRTVQVSEISLATRATRVNAAGTLGSDAARLNVALNTSDLSEFQPALAALRLSGQLPVILKGRAAFTGRVFGKLAAPSVAGHLEVGDFDTVLAIPQDAVAPSAPAKGTQAVVQASTNAAPANRSTRVHWDLFTADVEYSPSLIALHRGVLVRGKAQVSIDGSAQSHNGRFDEQSPFQLALHVRNADVHDLQTLAGFDYPLTGTLATDIQVSGTRADMRGAGNFQLVSGTFYGEPFKSLTADMRMAGREAQLSNIVLAHNGARISGSAAYDLTAKSFRFDLRGTGLNLADFRQLQSARLTSEGKGAFTAQGSGTVDAPVINGTLSVRDLVLNGEPVGDVEASATTRGADMHLTARSHFQTAEVAVDGDVHLRGDYPAQLKLKFSHLDADAVLRAYLQGRVTGSSQIAGTVDLKGPLKQPRLLNVSGTIDGFSAEIEKVKIASDGPIRFAMVDQVVRIEQLRLVGDQTDFTANGTIALVGARELNLRAAGHLNLKLVQTFNPDLLGYGETTVELAIGGTMDKPAMQGRVEIKGAGVSFIDLPNGLSDINGTLIFTENRLEVEKLTAKSGGGELKLGGFISYANGIYFNLTATSGDIRMRYPPGVSALASADLRFVGTTASSLLSGDVTVTRFGLNPRFDFALYLARSKQPPAMLHPDSPLNNLRFDVHIVSTPELQVETSMAKLSGNVDLRLRGTAARPIVLGKVNVIEGDVSFNGTKYHLERGDITLTNPVHIEPVMNVEATARVRDYDITLGFHGTLDKLSVTYRADPPLPTGDIIALIALGRTQEEAVLKPQSQQNFTELASNAILGQAINATVSSRAQKLFGISKIKIDPQAGGPESNPLARVTIEQQVSDKVTLTYITNLSQSAQQIVQVEYNVNRNVSIVAVRDQTGVVSFQVKLRQRKR
ncbi:MAG: translocation/assembly module TamB domain-containing protein [Candidatus Koribacter versatilis]|uniref:Translocation/assembly module TamB domain-containing protein n=1 Tax=Candidatus Korobacter versatilis TaxID=658062 RepID=A0A932EPS5_9BACT|nr:translocation/assembly module TamB domain-containing protein [Candidatus Koribacter versatilis]